MGLAPLGVMGRGTFSNCDVQATFKLWQESSFIVADGLLYLWQGVFCLIGMCGYAPL